MKKKLTSAISILLAVLFTASALPGCSSDTFSGGAGRQDAVSSPADTASPPSDTAALPDGSDPLRVYFLDVGQGDCTILTQGDSAMLIDAGDNDKGTAVQSYLEYLGIEELDYAVLTHPDADHIGGADVVLYKFDCDTILMPDAQTDTRTYDDVIQAMNAKGESAVHPAPGDVYEFGDACFTILAPVDDYDDNNNNSIVLRLDHGDNSFLFTGDAENQAEEDILSTQADVDADVLKVGHHGSSTSTSDAFLAAVSPDYAVISCGEDNKYGHPHAETLNRLRENGITVYRTDEQGTIVAESDGQDITWSSAPSDSWQSGEPSGGGQAVSDGASSGSQTSSGGSDTAAPPEQTGDVYILNTNTMKFHKPDCSSAGDISEQNRETSGKSREELIAEGYDPCGRCNP